MPKKKEEKNLTCTFKGNGSRSTYRETKEESKGLHFKLTKQTGGQNKKPLNSNKSTNMQAKE